MFLELVSSTLAGDQAKGETNGLYDSFSVTRTPYFSHIKEYLVKCTSLIPDHHLPGKNVVSCPVHMHLPARNGLMNNYTKGVKTNEIAMSVLAT